MLREEMDVSTLPVIRKLGCRALQRSERFKEETLPTNLLHWTPSGGGGGGGGRR
jgi:hypothetical protein